MDPATAPHLEAYVKGVVGKFGADHRVLAWDVWNEPDNLNSNSCAPAPLPNPLSPLTVLFDLCSRGDCATRSRRFGAAATVATDTQAEPVNKVELVMQLLPKVFRWAREARAFQPLTSGIWNYDLSDEGQNLRCVVMKCLRRMSGRSRCCVLVLAGSGLMIAFA